MKNIKIITDSASDIPISLEKELDILVLPFALTIDNESYYERLDFTPVEFYNVLEKAKSLPATSQITPIRFQEEFLKLYEQGYENIIYVSIASKGSGSYQAANLAKNLIFNEKPELQDKFNIFIIDSKTYAVGYGYPVVQAAKKANNGVSVDEIIAYLEDWFDCIEIYFAPYTLEFAKKSGRINVMAAFVGELMGIRPILSIIDGEIKIDSKVRGDKNIIPKILEKVKSRRTPGTEYCTVKSLILDEVTELDKKLEKETGMKVAASYEVGAAITINAGPRVVAVIIKGAKRNKK